MTTQCLVRPMTEKERLDFDRANTISTINITKNYETGQHIKEEIMTIHSDRANLVAKLAQQMEQVSQDLKSYSKPARAKIKRLKKAISKVLEDADKPWTLADDEDLNREE